MHLMATEGFLGPLKLPEKNIIQTPKILNNENQINILDLNSVIHTHTQMRVHSKYFCALWFNNSVEKLPKQ